MERPRVEAEVVGWGGDGYFHRVAEVGGVVAEVGGVAVAEGDEWLE